MKLVILFLCSHAFFLQNHKVSGQCRDEEQEALLEVKNGFFNFSPHSSIATWRPDIDCCKWEGIVCNKDTGKVVSLDINNSSIKGDGVSSKIFSLGDIEVLNLAYNHFNSSIPSGLDRFSKLTHLNLSYSGFTGQIPLEISTMTQLVSLDLSCYFFSSLKLENPNLSTLIKDLINLKQLHLEGLNISSKVPISLNKLSSLESLNLRSCLLSGDFPEEVFSFKNLTDLDISYNNDLKVVIPELPKNSILRSLKLSGTNLSLMSDDSLSKLDSLTRLDISGCDISGYLPYWTSTLRNLVYLDMSENKLVGNIYSLQNLTKLVHLRLSRNNFTGSILSLKHLTELVDLDLSENNFTGSIDSLQNLTELVQLDLSHNSFTSGLRHMKKLSQLSYLDLRHNMFNDDLSTFTRELENLINLIHLDLSYNEFTGEISFLDKFTKLNTLDISNNKFSGLIPKMENHQDLLQIDMRVNNLSGSMPSLSSSKNLEGIDLSSNRLEGKIPRSYGNLSHLYSLYAGYNLIEGPIPFYLFYHPSLVYLSLSNNRLNIITEEESINVTTSNLIDLDLSSNNLKGQIPSFLFHHPSLWSLDLSHNSLELIFEDDNINVTSSNIEELYLGSNHLKGPFPKGIFQLKKLGYLGLQYNNFSDTLNFELFSSLKDLTVLDLSEANLLLANVNSNFTFYHFPKVQDLRLSNCKLNGFPNFLRSAKKLYNLNLSNNNITGKIPKWIWNTMEEAIEDRSLNLSHNLLDGLEEPPWNISSFSVEVLDLSHNKFSGSISDILVTNITEAQLFSVENNMIIGKIPEIICNAKHLYFLDLSQNELIGSIPQCIGEMFGTLAILRLQGNKLQGKIPQSYSNGCKLRTLNLNGNQLEGDIPRFLENCRSLEVLDLGNNQLSGTFPFWLGSLNILRVLMMHSNRFYGGIDIANINCSFPSLQIIDISTNNFSGSIPLNCLQSFQTSKNENSTYVIEIPLGSFYYRDSVTLINKGTVSVIEKILYVFTSIDLSNNHFGGEIPKDIGKLKSIRLLNISGNHLIGPIPRSIGNLTKLEALDLSINNLSGVIPLELTSLTFLSTLNLSMNNFEGRIPEGNQLSTFKESSFLGNPGLCGQPLPIKCPENSPSYMNPGKASPSSFTKIIWFLFIFGFVIGLIVGVLVGNIVSNKRFKVQINRRLQIT